MAFGIDRALLQRLKEHRVFVFVMVGTEDVARRAIAIGADGLIAQGGEAGGHLCGDTPSLVFLPKALAIAGGRPVLLAGGIAAAADTRTALAAGANGVVAGTRFLLTHEARAHPEYQRRILAADKTFRTMLFGLGWPAPHRVVANAATRRWCHDDGADSAIRLQAPRLPLFTPAAPMVDMPESSVDRAALYDGDTVLRLGSVISAGQAVADLAPG
jgi:NAD(P)H-dependent flavin oxidoreductase YrpB (nitropropane dioxygenase family)